MPAVFTESISVNLLGFEEAKELMKGVPQKLQSVTRATIRDGLEFSKAEIVRQLTGRYAISKASLMDKSRRAGLDMHVDKPALGASGQLEGSISVSSNRFPVMRFTVSPQEVPNQKGIPIAQRVIVSVTTIKGRTMSGRPNIFLARMQSGHLGVFQRKPDATHRLRPDGQNTQLNIEEEFMVSPAEMLRGRHLRPQLEMKIREYMEKRFMVLAEKALKK